jgi:hypothetical protein
MVLDGVASDISSVFNAMGTLIIETLLLYFVLPLIVLMIIIKYLFKARGILLQILIGISAFVCFYFFVMNGLPNMTGAYHTYLNTD